jgi:hypothetical protein
MTADPDYYVIRQNGGIPHHPRCTWAQWQNTLALATGRYPITEATGMGGELIWTCHICGARAIWLNDQLQPDEEEDARQRRWHHERPAAPAPDKSPPVADTVSGDLPGGLTWGRIEATYKALAASEPSWQHRRPHPDQPSRPECAEALHVSIATLRRACATAGRGTQWPPRGL